MSDNIHLTKKTWLLDLQKCRSANVKEAKALDALGISGASDIKSGIVYIPTADTPEGLTVRMHEVLHMDFTPRSILKDMLDQALEDARLHAHCSATSQVASLGLTKPREYELAVAERDLNKVLSVESGNISPIHALAVLRSAAICQGEGGKYSLLVSRAAERIGVCYLLEVRKAIGLIGKSKGKPRTKAWRQARELLLPYFIEKPKPKPPEPNGQGKGDAPKGDVPGGNPAPRIPPAYKPKTPAKPKTELKPNQVDPEKFCPEFDSGDYNQYQRSNPIRMFIRRLDLGIDRTRTDLGKSNLRYSFSGTKISPNRLALSQVNPKLPIFLKRAARGNAGSVLIDASGSMHLKNEDLESFCAFCPSAVVAFYAGGDVGAFSIGNIWVYAANGRRCRKLEMRKLRSNPNPLERLQGDNLVDYQALAWLIQQPGPRYLVSDTKFTGDWATKAHELLDTCKQRRLVTVCTNLKELLQKLKQK